MLTGILLALLTGICWTIVGITFSQAAQRGLHPAIMCLFHGFGVSVITAGWINWQGINTHTLPTLATCMTIAGIASTGGMIALQNAMRHGNHSTSWAIMQMGLICPFVVAVVFHGETPGIGPWAGLGVIVLSLFLLTEKKSNQQTSFTHAWIIWVAAAWICTGLQQISFQWPSFALQQFSIGEKSFIDPGAIRIPIFMFISALTALFFYCLTASRQRQQDSAQESKPTAQATNQQANWRIVGALSAISIAANIIGQPAMAASSDYLAASSAGGIAFPIAIASCITLFTFYSMAFRREKMYSRMAVGLACCLTGALLLSL